MSNTKGSMLISNANAVGAELVNKLGGTGYKPVEWADAINLLGIKSSDIPTALAGIISGSYTGSERGAIKYNNCNAVGSMLNKKFSTDRGFKPVEWESAISKLTPLAERTVSGSIVTFSDGAEDVPLKSCEVALAPSLDGYSSVDVVHTGKNLFDYEAVEAFNANVIITRNDGDYTMQNNNSYGVGAFRGISFHLKPSSYSLSLGEAITVPIRIYKNDAWFNNGINAGNTSCTFTVTEEDDYTFSCNVPANSSLTIKKCQLEIGSTAHAYEPYETPTTYTVSLGRTIYGGSVDIVNGTGKETYKRTKISDLSWSIQTVSGRSTFVSGQVTGLPTTSPKTVLCDVLPYDGEKTIGVMTNKTLVTWTNTFRIYDTDCAVVTEFLSTYGNGYIVYQLKDSAQSTFTFDGQEINTRLGNNTMWSDGDMSVTYRKDPDIPDPPVQLLNTDNNENNDN